MLIYANTRSPKKIKNQKKRRQARKQEEYNQWLASLDKLSPNFGSGKTSVKKSNFPTLQVPPGRETPHHPSLQTDAYNCMKPVQGKVYTGTKMLGIGTLHKSNAVPIFSEEEARDQATMRR